MFVLLAIVKEGNKKMNIGWPYSFNFLYLKWKRNRKLIFGIYFNAERILVDLRRRPLRHSWIEENGDIWRKATRTRTDILAVPIDSNSYCSHKKNSIYDIFQILRRKQVGLWCWQWTHTGRFVFLCPWTQIHMMKIQIHTVHVTLGRFFLDQNLKTKKAEIIEVGFVPGFCKLCPWKCLLYCQRQWFVAIILSQSSFLSTPWFVSRFVGFGIIWSLKIKFYNNGRQIWFQQGIFNQLSDIMYLKPRL